MARIQDLLSENIRKLREGKNLTQEQLSRRMGVSRGTVARYESDLGSGYEGKTIALFAEALQIEESDLVTQKPEIDKTAEKAAEIALSRYREIALIPRDILAAAENLKPADWDLVRDVLGITSPEKRADQAQKAPQK